MIKPFGKFNVNTFWKKSKYAKKEYEGAKLTSEMIQTVEQKTGYKLPAAYIALMTAQNGGIPLNTNYPTKEPTSWAQDHVAITGIFGLDNKKSYSLLGKLGSEFMKSEWGYPDIGIYICDCPSAGHDMIALDYRKCGKNGEPEVVHVDQELDYKITFLSSSFEDFITGLVSDDAFDIQVTEDAEYIWKPEAITFKINKADKLIKIPPMIELNQKLAQSESGWTQSRFSIPESWTSALLEMVEGRILVLVNGKKYYIDKENSTKLSFEILSVGKITDSELEEIWNKYAGSPV